MQNPPPGPPPGGQPPRYPPQGGQQPGYPPPGGQQPGYPPQGGQQPGSYPPPGYQPPGYQQQPSGAPAIDKKTGAVLAYLLWWVSGIIFLYVGRADPDVKFHAAQSTIFFGAITVIGAFLAILPFRLLGFVSFLLLLFGVVVWVMCLSRASNAGGARFDLPWVGGVVTPYAEQLANAVN